MDSIGDMEHMEWTLKHLEYVLNYELGCFKAGSDETWFNGSLV